MATILEKSGFNPDKKLKIVGTSPVKHDGIDKVTGRAKFGADLYLPGMLVGKILRSPHPHARIKSIDTSAAEKLPGVKAIVTGVRSVQHFDDYPRLLREPIPDALWAELRAEHLIAPDAPVPTAGAGGG